MSDYEEHATDLWTKAYGNVLLRQIIEYYEDEIDEQYDGERELAQYICDYFDEMNDDEIVDFYACVEDGEAIANRILELKTIPPGSVAFSQGEAATLVESMLSSVRSLALDCGNQELFDYFSASQIVSRSVDHIFPNSERNQKAKGAIAAQTETILTSADGCDSDAAALRPAINKLCNSRLLLVAYVQWPLYAHSIETSEPFRPFVELRNRGIFWQLDPNDPNVVAFTTVSGE